MTVMSGPGNKAEMAATLACLVLMIAMGTFLVVRWWMY